MSRPSSDSAPLTDRERAILRAAVQAFVKTAGPVGSRALAEQFDLGISPASIRNTLSALDAAGYLDQPHTSAGRVPTPQGYRTFVDELMSAPLLSTAEKHLLRAELDRMSGDTDTLLRETSKLLGTLSNLLGVVLKPRLATGVLERIEAVPVSSSRVIFVLSLRDGLVKTILLELDTDVPRDRLERVVQRLNERISGLAMDEIRRTFAERVRGLEDETQAGLVRLIVDRSHAIFADPESERVEVSSTSSLLGQPEFQQPAELRRLIAMLEDERFLVQLLDAEEAGRAGVARIVIGREGAAETEGFSIVTARYQIGGALGTVGLIGPTRMDYSRAVGIVEQAARTLSGAADAA
jgi:heat-inducible transcriptional repressor